MPGPLMPSLATRPLSQLDVSDNELLDSLPHELSRLTALSSLNLLRACSPACGLPGHLQALLTQPEQLLQLRQLLQASSPAKASKEAPASSTASSCGSTASAAQLETSSAQPFASWGDLLRSSGIPDPWATVYADKLSREAYALSDWLLVEKEDLVDIGMLGGHRLKLRTLQRRHKPATQ